MSRHDKPRSEWSMDDEMRHAFGDAIVDRLTAKERKSMNKKFTITEDGFGFSDVSRLVKSLGDDPNREGLLDTPSRVIAAWGHWSSGYGMDAKEVLKSFEDGAEGVNEIVVQTNVPIYSHCEHHLAPFWGVAHIGYIPSGRVVGLSKFKRLADVFALRLQVQERLTQQIATAFHDEVKPLATGVILQCRHMCMESRGICTAGSTTMTSALLGAFHDDRAARTEFLQLVRMATNGKAI